MYYSKCLEMVKETKAELMYSNLEILNYWHAVVMRLYVQGFESSHCLHQYKTALRRPKQDCFWWSLLWYRIHYDLKKYYSTCLAMANENKGKGWQTQKSNFQITGMRYLHDLKFKVLNPTTADTSIKLW